MKKRTAYVLITMAFFMTLAGVLRADECAELPYDLAYSLAKPFEADVVVLRPTDVNDTKPLSATLIGPSGDSTPVSIDADYRVHLPLDEKYPHHGYVLRVNRPKGSMNLTFFAPPFKTGLPHPVDCHGEYTSRQLMPVQIELKNMAQRLQSVPYLKMQVMGLQVISGTPPMVIRDFTVTAHKGGNEVIVRSNNGVAILAFDPDKIDDDFTMKFDPADLKIQAMIPYIIRTQ